MKTQRFSYFAGFAARRPAAAGQFRPVSRGGTSCFMREAKPVKLKKVAFSHFFDTLQGGKSHPVFYTFFQVSGVKTIIIGNISSLPMSISSVSTILDKAEKSE